MKAILLVGLGGGIGSIFRYLTTVVVSKWSHSAISPATFIANILGCILVGIIFGIIEKQQIISNDLKLLLITGFCGGYTTFSAFSLENLQLIQSGHAGHAIVYALSSIILGILAVWGGIMIVKAI
jgi:CrcB protein